MHQSAGRVVDKHPQGALRPAALEPPMLAAVDLYQFANALAPRPWPVDAFALLAIAPQPVGDHPLAQRFTTNCNPIILAQLLGRQRRAKIPVNWRMIIRTACRTASGLRRLLRRPRRFEIRPIGP